MTSKERYFLSGVDLATLPKISLHDHLDGGLRPTTIIELADEIGHKLPENEPKALAEWFHQNADSHDLVRYLTTFDQTLAVMQTKTGLRRVAREFVQDLAADGVIYGELRWAPEQHLARGLTLDEVVEAVQEGIDAGVTDVRDTGNDIQVGQLLCAMRHLDRSLEIAELAVRHRNSGVVGFDIAGPEVGFPPLRHKLAFEYLAQNFFPTTVHAGEEGGLESITEAIVAGRALRLGHGVHVAEDIRVEETEDGLFGFCGELSSWVKDRGIVLECCPSSNLQTAAMDGIGETMEDHPIDLFYELGMRVTVNVDNRLMSNTSMTKEFAILADTFSYDLADFEVFTLNAAEGSFLPQDERELLAEKVSSFYDELG